MIGSKPTLEPGQNAPESLVSATTRMATRWAALLHMAEVYHPWVV